MKKRPSLRNMDLNLFLVFEAIYREGNLTRAGKRLGLSQPAVSHAIGRLRHALGDELFVRRRGGVNPTPFSRSIIEDVSSALGQLRSSVSGEPQFDPLNSNAVFYISMSLGFEAGIMPALHKSLAKNAPNITVNSARLERRSFESELAKGEINIAIDVAGPVGPDIMGQRLWVDPRIVVSRPDHPIVSNGLTAKSYLASDHVVVSSRKRGGALEDFDLAKKGKKRHVKIRCGSLSAGLEIVAATDCLLTLGKHQLDIFSSNHNLHIHEYPFPDKEIEILMYWHQDSAKDPGNVWLRELVTTCASTRLLAESEV